MFDPAEMKGDCREIISNFFVKMALVLGNSPEKAKQFPLDIAALGPSAASEDIKRTCLDYGIRISD